MKRKDFFRTLGAALLVSPVVEAAKGETVANEITKNGWAVFRSDDLPDLTEAEFDEYTAGWPEDTKHMWRMSSGPHLVKIQLMSKAKS